VVPITGSAGKAMDIVIYERSDFIYRVKQHEIGVYACLFGQHPEQYKKTTRFEFPPINYEKLMLHCFHMVDTYWSFVHSLPIHSAKKRTFFVIQHLMFAIQLIENEKNLGVPTVTDLHCANSLHAQLITRREKSTVLS